MALSQIDWLRTISVGHVTYKNSLRINEMVGGRFLQSDYDDRSGGAARFGRITAERPLVFS